MTTQQLMISGILFLAMLMFGWGRFRYDLVAMSALVACVVAGLVPTEVAFDGFGHSAVITVAAVLIISSALKNAGVVDEIGSRIMHLTETPIMHIGVLTIVVTIASAFMNNVGALALMLPIALSTAHERDRSPALILMPLAFGSLLGGMTTQIGTPPNIIIANIRADHAGQPFSMFDFSPVGIPIMIVGFLFITFFGWRLIPRQRLESNMPKKLLEIGMYLTEVRVNADSNLIGQTLGEVDGLEVGSIEVIGVAGKRRFAKAVRADYQIAEKDVLILRAEPTELRPFLDLHKLELVTSATPAFVEPEKGNETMLEGVVSNNSELIGNGVEFLRRKTGRNVALVGIARNGHSVTRRLRQQVFRAGDVLLVKGDSETIETHFGSLGLWPLAQRALDLDRSKRVVTALLIFGFAILAGILKLVTLPIAFLLAIMVYLLTGILSVRQIYDDIDWPVIVLLAAMIPVGNALTTTGTTDLVAQSLVGWTEGMPVWLVLTLVLVVTMLLSDIINNAATALVMAPLGIAMAAALGVNSDPFLMAVAVGASCAFLTPIGHQCNTLVMGPGGYEFSDYWRMGLPLEILITIIAVPMIMWAWPL